LGDDEFAPVGETWTSERGKTRCDLVLERPNPLEEGAARHASRKVETAAEATEDAVGRVFQFRGEPHARAETGNWQRERGERERVQKKLKGEA